MENIKAGTKTLITRTIRTTTSMATGMAKVKAEGTATGNKKRFAGSSKPFFIVFVKSARKMAEIFTEAGCKLLP